MYNLPAFAMADEAALQDILRAEALPVLISPQRGGGLLATHLPLLFQAPGKLVGHIAKANSHWRDYDPDQESLAIFTAAQGYVSPSWYASKQEHGRVVPTWNYSAVHATGRLTITQDPDELLALVTALTNRHEQPRPQPWQVSDAPAEFIAGQLKGIVGITLTLTKLEGKAKLSQNRPLADREGVVKGASAENPAMAEAVRRTLPF